MKQKGFRRGFTISELLIAMVIIAMLGAIGTPAFLSARENAQRNKDISHMNAIRSALQTYYVDRGEYPKSLYACVNEYDSVGKLTGRPPDSKVQYGLYPKRMNTKEVFKSEKQSDKVSVDQEDLTLVVARYPQKPTTRRPIEKGQLFGTGDGYVNITMRYQKGKTLPQNAKSANATKYYKFSVYDAAKVPGLRPDEHELRYTRFWTRWGLGDGSPDDDTHQLGYAYPPEDTVVTWNSCYRKYSQGRVTDSSKDLVLFLSGAVKQISSQTVIDKAWTVLPSDK